MMLLLLKTETFSAAIKLPFKETLLGFRSLNPISLHMYVLPLKYCRLLNILHISSYNITVTSCYRGSCYISLNIARHCIELG